QANYADKMSPIAKRHYARHYVRLGTSALNAGDMRVALRYANLAVHFDPQSLDASNLRSAAADTQPEYDNQLHNYLKDGLRPWQHPVRDYTNRGFPWTNGNPPEESPVVVEEVHELGSPGRSITLDPGQPPQRRIPVTSP
ncbi:MAG TPA: hypothetical protein VL096_18295, partial [Pirellulaceae bacterium]|nr:hypothetical protein [Pirellulaceae bacterium]